MRRPRLATAALLCALAFRAGEAFAQDPPTEAAQEAAKAAKAEASEHYQKGRKLLGEKANAAALAEFVLSRKIYPTWQATSSAGVCLVELERYDEALEVFEVFLRDYGERIPPDAKKAAQAQVVALRKLTGVLTFGAGQLGAIVVVDGRYRGEYPTPGPLYVIAGAHIVRMYKEGFTPFEGSVRVGVGESVPIEARLEPLVKSGRLRVEEAGGRVLDVVVDGIPVGSTPWEGPIAAGEHAIVLRSPDNYGTLPSQATVKVNETKVVALKAENLGASLRIVPDPPTASVALDGFFVGRGAFEGRLRPGEHPIKVVADGYFSETQKVTVATGDERTVKVKLRRDPDSPVWAKPGRFALEVSGGVALTPTFGGAIGAGCEHPCVQDAGLGGMATFHGGYELANRFGFGVQAGYLNVQQQTTGREAELRIVGRAPSSGTANDSVKVRGLMVGGFASYTLGDRFPVRLRLGMGAVIGAVSDTRTGSFRTTELDARYDIGPVIQVHSMVWFYVNPEVRVGFKIGEHLELGAGVSIPLLVAPQPAQWTESWGINAFSDGWGSFERQDLTSGIVFAIAPGISARYEL
jgi:hypothetical protein